MKGKIMQIRKLTTADEWIECDRLHSIAFLFEDWNEKEARERFQKEEAGELDRNEEAWGAFSKEKMTASVVTNDRVQMFFGKELQVGELHMVGTLPEERGNGYVRELIRTILRDFQDRGYAMAMLIPFSCSFYRKYGFELCSNILKQKASIEQFSMFKNELHARLLDKASDVDIVKALYSAFIRDKNLASVKTERDYEYRGNGEFGEPDFFHAKNRQYTYLFFDEKENAKGYIKFIFVTGENGPFVGDMQVQEIVYDSAATFCSMLGFIGGMGAKVRNVIFEMIDDIDLTNLLPEGDQIERTLDSHVMMRALNVKELLLRMRTKAKGHFVLTIEDYFLTENTKTWEVCLTEDGPEVTETDAEADLILSVQTFTQLINGKIGIKEALYRQGTVLSHNEELLAAVFTKRSISLT